MSQPEIPAQPRIGARPVVLCGLDADGKYYPVGVDKASGALVSADAALADGTALAAVVDQGIAFVAGGTTDCTTATQVATAQTGGGYLTISNLDASATIYVGLTGVTSSTGIPIPAGGQRTVRYAAVETIYAIGSATVGWAVER